MLQKFKLIFHTVKYLKLRQIFNRIKRKYLKPSINKLPAPNISEVLKKPQDFIPCQIKMLDVNCFEFLNSVAKINTAKDWNEGNQDKLWLYNLHYFDDLKAIESSKRANWHSHLIERWIAENPPGLGNGWEAYPSSLRIINWIKWSLTGNYFEQKWLDSLATQVRYLSKNLETHLLGNHLFTNAKALVFAGLFFKGEESDSWYKNGIRIIEKELAEQVLDDGGNFELSPMYHSIFLEDLLDLVNIHRTFNKEVISDIEVKIPSMLFWLNSMCHPDGGVSFFNDTTFNIAPSLDELLDYTNRLSIKKISKKNNPLLYLKDSGYIRIDRENLVAIIDVADIGADYIPGHGHADALSFELSIFENRIIVNSGISVYGISSERHKQRSTLAHSTVVIDEQNSSEVWGGFRVGRRANVLNIKTENNKNCSKVSASHDGYTRLNGSPLHSREWSFYDNKLVIIDSITGKQFHRVSSILPLHPEVLIKNIQDNYAQLEINGKLVKITFEGDGELKVVASSYHPEFGLSIDNNKLIYSYSGSLPLTGIIKITW
tara:strand:+ start:5164 stop:6798 length:1635 start_codon:yes stop_codon:yes gene_type:complete